MLNQWGAEVGKEQGLHMGQYLQLTAMLIKPCTSSSLRLLQVTSFLLELSFLLKACKEKPVPVSDPALGNGQFVVIFHLFHSLCARGTGMCQLSAPALPHHAAGLLVVTGFAIPTAGGRAGGHWCQHGGTGSKRNEWKRGRGTLESGNHRRPSCKDASFPPTYGCRPSSR